MDLAFNEISFQPYFKSSHDLQKEFMELIEVFKNLKNEYGFENMVFPSEIYSIDVLEKESFSTWVNELKGLPKSQILSLIKKPFSHDAIEGSTEELEKFYFINEELGIEAPYCTGLGLAFILDSATLSLSSHEFWQAEQIQFLRSSDNTILTVLNSSSNSPLSARFIQFAESIAKIELEKTENAPDEKPINLRDDHGKDVLTSFAKKLVQSEYVVEVINSLPFNPNTSRFIRRSMKDGKIEIVLHWTDSGYGMVIQTTGRNFRETEKIAYILRDKYDR